MADDPEPAPAPPGWRRWRPLLLFWAALLLAAGAGAGVLQLLGPPPAAPVAASVAPHAPAPSPPPASPPWRADAAAWDKTQPGPRVAILLTGIGLSESDDAEALQLPAAVSLAISPYATAPARIAAVARAAGHEVLLGVPMEPQGYPLDDPGPLALLTGQSQEVNAAKLTQVLGLFSGYAGITNAIGTMRGERFSAGAGMADVLHEAAARGLMFIDARPGTAAAGPPGLMLRVADAVVDRLPFSHEIDRRLADLLTRAKSTGSALGVAGPPAPVTVLRLAEWAHGLARDGVVLVPASALVRSATEKQP